MKLQKKQLHKSLENPREIEATTSRRLHGEKSFRLSCWF